MPAPTVHDFVPAWITRSSEEPLEPRETAKETDMYRRKVEGHALLKKALAEHDLAGVNAAFTVFQGSQAQETGQVFMEQWLQDPDKSWVVNHLLQASVPEVSVDKMVEHWAIMRAWYKVERLLAAALPVVPEQAHAWIERCGPDKVPQAEARRRAQMAPSPERPSRSRRLRS